MVQIVTDSSVLYTREEAKKAGFELMPLCINIGDLEDRDMEVDMDEFYGRIKKGEHPRSSQPPIGEVMDVYEKYADDTRAGVVSLITKYKKQEESLLKEKERLEAMVLDNPNYFYDILPYTYVLGISDKWIKQFEEIGLTEPDWYDGTDHFSPKSFGKFMDQTMTSAKSSMSSSPSSSGGGGGGGSSGGGSSGGGSGGGGGGSW